MTHPDGRQQRYWVSLERFMKERGKGVMIRRIPRKEYDDIAVPEEEAPEWQMEFIENLEDFNVAGLKIDDNDLEVEIVAEVRVKKNGKPVGTFPIKVDKESVAKAILKKLMRL